MGTFDFLSGMAAPNANAQAQMPMQQYQQFQPVNDYSQVLGGGQAQSPATQGLDFSKIGQWALQKSQYPGQGNGSPSYAQALQMLQGAGQQQQQGQQGQPWQLPQPERSMPAGQSGHLQSGQAGYIGNGTRLGLLGSVR